MSRHYFFAGGGTGGHIYPAVAVADSLLRIDPDATVCFFCSSRPVDAMILSKTGREFFPMPAAPFSATPRGFMRFFGGYFKSREFVRQILIPSRPAVMVGIGGFASAPAISAARSLRVPVALLNVDMVPGKANKLMARRAEKVFVQWDRTREYMPKIRGEIVAAGCPLREGFGDRGRREGLLSELGLSADRRTLLVTGGSSGAYNLNRAVGECLQRLGAFAGNWQIVHVTGPGIEEVQRAYEDAPLPHAVVEYYHDMPALMSCSELVVGRAGAVSVAEYAAAGVASVMLPYPYHKDQHQRLNASTLVEAGAGVVVEDRPDDKKRTAAELLSALTGLMGDERRVSMMARAAAQAARPDAAATIAAAIVQMAGKLPNG